MDKEADKKVRYLCDGEKPECKRGGCYKNGGPCKHTSDINHAKNFLALKKTDTRYWEDPHGKMAKRWGIQKKNKAQKKFTDAAELAKKVIVTAWMYAVLFGTFVTFTLLFLGMEEKAERVGVPFIGLLMIGAIVAFVKVAKEVTKDIWG